jgi:hypothetical protein
MNEAPKAVLHAVANEEWQRIVLAGKVGTGKTFLTLTGELNIQVLYSDRMGGDADIKGLEDAGVHVFRVNYADPRTSMMNKIALLRDKEIAEKKIRTIVWDTATYTQQQARDKTAGGNANSMTLKKHGAASNDILDITQALFGLPCHIVVLAHLKEVPIMGTDSNGKPTKIGSTWQPDMMDSVYKRISREASLMGYTWKKRETGKDDRYGVCFVDKLGNIVFADTKAPNGWGGSEPANIRLWIERMKKDTAMRRETARQALLTNVDQSKETIEPESSDEE